MSLNRDAMYAAFEQSPGDLAGYAAMSDELRELGYEKLAHAFAWMSRRGVWPHHRQHYGVNRSSAVQGRRVPKRYAWTWYQALPYRDDARLTLDFPRSKYAIHALPSPILLRPHVLFASHQAAVMWLAERLADLRAMWEVEPAKPAGLPLIDVSETSGVAREVPWLAESTEEAT